MIAVTFPDGSVFSTRQDSKTQAEVFVKSIKKLIVQFGVNRILEADMLTRERYSKERIISTDPTFRDRSQKKKSTAHTENGITYYITHDYNIKDKKRFLDDISGVLGAGLIVDVS